MKRKIDVDYICARVREVGAKRVVLVFNPRSSKAARVEREVVKPLEVFELVKYEVLPTNVDDNAEKLSRVLRDGDVVVSAGGDGTATIALNGCALSGCEVFLAALPYGNFNDMARSLMRAQGGEYVFPMEAVIDGKHFRYAMCYFTLGLFAESTEIFDGKNMRKDLQTGKKGMVYSVRELAGWYFENKKREFLPRFVVERKCLGAQTKKIVCEKKSDYLAVNGVSVAKMMRGRKWYLEEKCFWGSVGKLTSFWKLSWFMARSVIYKVPGEIVEQDRLVFDAPADVEIQAEGEYRKLTGVSEIAFKKVKSKIRVL